MNPILTFTLGNEKGTKSKKLKFTFQATPNTTIFISNFDTLDGALGLFEANFGQI
jgi:hypothetical protein